MVVWWHGMVWYGIPEGTPRMAAKMGGAMPTAAAAGGAAASAASEKRLELGLLRNLHRIEVKSIYDIYIYIYIIYYLLLSTIYQKMVTHSQFFLHASPPDPTVSRILKRRLKVVQLSDACISHHT